jgi:hypothetical protein
MVENEKAIAYTGTVAVVFGMLLCMISGCATGRKGSGDTGPFDPAKMMDAAYSEISLVDGIDREEATFLAGAYFTLYISGCGGTEIGIDRGDKWEVKTVIGVAAVPYESIFVEKATGVISCNKGPVVTP